MADQPHVPILILILDPSYIVTIYNGFSMFSSSPLKEHRLAMPARIRNHESPLPGLEAPAGLALWYHAQYNNLFISAAKVLYLAPNTRIIRFGLYLLLLIIIDRTPTTHPYRFQ